jgi:hypothetical protein
MISVRKSAYKVQIILCQIVMKLEFSRWIFEKSSNIKFN